MATAPDFFVEQPTIVTERLLLRPIAMSDAQEIYEYCCRDEVTKFVRFETHKSIADTEAFIASIIANDERGRVWAIVLKERNTVIGTIGIHKVELQNQKLEVGYALSNDFWNKGITTEALRALIQTIFEQTTINRIEALAMIENPPSAKVMEKAGMKFEGVLREFVSIKGVLRSMNIYSIIRKDYYPL